MYFREELCAAEEEWDAVETIEPVVKPGGFDVDSETVSPSQGIATECITYDVAWSYYQNKDMTHYTIIVNMTLNVYLKLIF